MTDLNEVWARALNLGIVPDIQLCTALIIALGPRDVSESLRVLTAMDTTGVLMLGGKQALVPAPHAGVFAAAIEVCHARASVDGALEVLARMQRHCDGDLDIKKFCFGRAMTTCILSGRMEVARSLQRQMNDLKIPVSDMIRKSSFASRW